MKELINNRKAVIYTRSSVESAYTKKETIEYSDEEIMKFLTKTSQNRPDVFGRLEMELVSLGKEELLMKIFSFVENNYRAECTLYNASRAIGYDNAYISRYFKRMTGISYNSYVNLNRLSYASYLLKNTSLSILECSIDSGFKSLRSFNRNFKEHFKKTPQEYRE